MELKILGTVSPYCKNEMNCPGYLITSDNEKLLLDCGPGISRYMNLPADLQNLTIILSHLHKDHYGDLLSLGYASFVFHNLGYLNERIKVYIPAADYYVTDESLYDNDGWSRNKHIKKALADYTFLQEFGEEQYLEFIPYKETDNLKLGTLSVEFSKNPHQINTYSTKIVENENTLVYSSDTGFQDNTVTDLAHKADILLCEATFLKGQQRTGNNHLYAKEAATIAKKAGVKKLVLTHFFPEIPKEKYVLEAKEIFDNTIAAEENKILTIGGIK